MAARRALAAACLRDGQQAILLTWPAEVVSYLPRSRYVQRDFDVILGHIEGCPVYADIRRVARARDWQVVLDADPRSSDPRSPVLLTRAVRPQPSRSALPADRITQAG